MASIRRFTALGGAAALALSVSAFGARPAATPPLAAPAPHRAATVQPGPAGATTYTGYGFDTCAAPAQATMNAWLASPYRAVAIYIGGAGRRCAQPNLTQDWVTQQASAGWHFIPVYTGPQAGELTSPASQGASAADDAISQAASLGFGPGNPVYYQLRAPYPASQAAAVLEFLSAWASELHGDGYLAGVYAGSATIRALAQHYRDPAGTVPDLIYDAAPVFPYRPPGTTRHLPVPPADWPGHQRIDQYTPQVRASYGGVSLPIEADYLDVATLATPDASLDTQWNGYGDNAGCATWSGGDATNSVALPGGDRAWFFSDTYLGSPADRKTLLYSSSIHNSIVLQDSTGLAKTITGGNTCQERNTSLPFADRYALTPAAAPDAATGGFYWTGDQMVTGQNVVKFYYHGVPDAGLFSIDTSAVATIGVTSLETGSALTITPRQFSCGALPDVIWGSALLNWHGATYVYGWNGSALPGGNVYYLAKTTPANLTQPQTWQVFTGLDHVGRPVWGGCGAAPAALPLPRGSGLSVTALHGVLWLIQQDTQGLAAGPISAHPAATPWGFTGRHVVLYYPPEGHHTYPDYYLVYEARLQPGLTAGSGADVVLSYNVNSTAVDTGCVGAPVHDAHIYRPRFLDVPVTDFNPALATAGAATPPAAKLAARAAGTYGIRHARPVRHQAGMTPAGAGPVAAGPARTAAGQDPGSIDGATDWTDEWATLTCPQVGAPAAPQAAVTPRGKVNLTWNSAGTDVWYYAFQCDVTATGCPADESSGFSQIWGGLWSETPSGQATPVTSKASNGDAFEWYVRAFGAQSGNAASSPPSAPVTVTVTPP
jgi:hypothetical protein